jgi:hypothetical protein
MTQRKAAMKETGVTPEHCDEHKLVTPFAIRQNSLKR